MKDEDSHKKHKKRRSDEHHHHHHHHHEKTSKRFRHTSNDEDNTEEKDTDNIEATYVNIEYLIDSFFFSLDLMLKMLWMIYLVTLSMTMK
jgi:hypothetical protein